MPPTPADGEMHQLRSRVLPAVSPVLEEAAQLGFLGATPVREQVDHALGFVFCAESDHTTAPQAVADLGSGGGLPGLVLASCWRETMVTLIDSNERRTAFLQASVDAMFGTDRVFVVRARAEEFGRDDARRGTFDTVTARSFGPPAVTAECAAALLSPGGILIVSEPPEAESSSRWPEAGLSELGLRPRTPIRFADRFNYQTVEKSGETPDRYPRRVGIPSKRPLF